MSRAKNLLDIWDLYSKQIISEKKLPKMSKQGPGAKNLNDMKARTVAEPKKTGPDGVDNFNGPAFNRKISDLKTMSDKELKERPYVAQLNVSVEKFNTNMEKTTKTIINNNMKSTFDKLFEEVMGSDDVQDLDALGVDTEAEGMGGDEVGGEITVTLSPEHVDALRAILAQIDGEGMGEGEVDMEAETSVSDDDMGSEEDAEEKMKKKHDKEEDAEEEDDKDMATEGSAAVDAGSDLADSHGLGLTKVSSGSNKVGDKTAKLAGKGKADSKITAPVDAGKDLPDSHGHSMTKVSSGSNVVKSKLKAGAEAFGIS
jgi:hypothetical protein